MPFWCIFISYFLSSGIEERLTLLKLLVMTDMGPRTAWALMIASTISLVAVGGYWAVPFWGILLAWAISLFWLWLVWSAYKAGQTPYAAKLKKIEIVLKWGLAAFYLSLGSMSLTMNTPLEDAHRKRLQRRHRSPIASHHECLTVLGAYNLCALTYSWLHRNDKVFLILIIIFAV